MFTASKLYRLQQALATRLSVPKSELAWIKKWTFPANLATLLSCFLNYLPLSNVSSFTVATQRNIPSLLRESPDYFEESDRFLINLFPSESPVFLIKLRRHAIFMFLYLCIMDELLCVIAFLFFLLSDLLLTTFRKPSWQEIASSVKLRITRRSVSKKRAPGVVRTHYHVGISRALVIRYKLGLGTEKTWINGTSPR